MSRAKRDEQWHHGQIEEFTRLRPYYERFAEVLQEILERACQLHSPRAFVQARAKTHTGFSEKAWRLRIIVKNPARRIDDLCAARVITLTRRDTVSIGEFIEEHFLVDPRASLDTATRLGPAEFGYRSVHYTVHLRPGVFPTADMRVEIPPELLAFDPPLTAEIQVRTLLDHAWAEFSHDRLYKSDGKLEIGEVWERRAARLAALLEHADESLVATAQDLDVFLEHYDAYLTRDEIAREIETLKVALASAERVRDKDPEQADVGALTDVALRIARVARSVRRWSDVVDVLKPYVREPGVNSAWIQTLYGQALCNLHEDNLQAPEYAEGVELLNRIGRPDEFTDEMDLGEIRPNRLRAEALAALARSHERHDADLTVLRPLCRMALAHDPANPYLLAPVLEGEIRHHGQWELPELVYPQIASALRSCREHAVTGIEKPRCSFTMGWLYLYSRRNYPSLRAFCEAAFWSRDAKPIRDALDRLVKLQGEIDEQSYLEGLASAARLLLVLEAGKLWELAESTAAHAQERAVQVEAAKEELSRLSERSGPGSGDEAKKRVADASLRAKAAHAGETEARERFEASIAGIDRALPSFESTDAVIRPPVVIMTGGTDPRIESEMGLYRHAVEEAFAGFSGTVIGGGTTKGISGIVGTITARECGRRGAGAMISIGYHPEDTAQRADLDGTYTHLVPCGGSEFSALQPLQSWIDLLTAGVKPSQVRLLGINGGEIAAFEYRLALALGATVGVVECSGRAASDLLEEGWWPEGKLLALPLDKMTIRAFVHAGGRTDLDEEKLNEAARVVHEEYARQRQQKLRAPETDPWERLSEQFKESSRQQTAYAVNILRDIGWSVRPRTGQPGVREFTHDEVERMAEMEHGRWVVERLLAGWRRGKVKDVNNKISPHIRAWNDLQPGVKEYDRAAARNFPDILKKLGLEVFPDRKAKKGGRK